MDRRVEQGTLLTHLYLWELSSTRERLKKTKSPLPPIPSIHLSSGIHHQTGKATHRLEQ